MFTMFLKSSQNFSRFLSTSSSGLRMMHQTHTVAIQSHGEPINKKNGIKIDVSGRTERTFSVDSTLSSVFASDDFSSDDFKSTSLIVPSQKNARKKVKELVDDGFTINKLKFSSLGLYGRSKETKLLNDCLDRITIGEDSRRQVVLISGYSGVGKSRLAMHVKDSLKQRQRGSGTYISGKFDLQEIQPFSGIISACDMLCHEILKKRESSDDDYPTIQQNLLSALGNESEILAKIIPSLSAIVGERSEESQLVETTMSSSSSSSSASSEEIKNRIHFALLRFLREVISNLHGPVVMVLDDIQWADSSSLEIFEMVATDQEIPQLMLIGLYRSNEVDETHLVAKMIQNLENKSQDNDLDICKLPIDNLDIEGVQEFIRDLLSAEDNEKTWNLAKICHKKTQGNAFFLIHFLQSLKDLDLLTFNFGLMSWIWEETAIVTATEATDNVVDLLLSQIWTLPGTVIEMLKVASCLGSTFESNSLNVVWNRMEPTGNTSMTYDYAKGVCLEKGFLIEIGEERLRWAHDKIRETALSLVVIDNTCQFQKMVGRTLLEHLKEEKVESSIFVIVNLLNHGVPPAEEEERLNLSRLNLRAGKKAVDFGSFEAASKFTALGLDLLPEEHWHGDLTDFSLQLYSLGAESEAHLGNVETVERYSRVVIDQAHVSTENKFRIYLALMSSISNEGRMKEAIDVGLRVLKDCGHRFPSNKLTITLSTLKSIISLSINHKTLLRKLQSSGSMEDNRRVELMKILDKLSTCCYIDKNDLMPLCILRSLKWTLRDGICQFSSPSITLTGLIMAHVLNDLQSGSKFSEEALNAMSRAPSRGVESRTIFTTYAFTLNWTNPYPYVMKELLKGYEVGMRTGDAESAMWCIYFYVLISFYGGAKLDIIQNDCKVYGKQMKELKNLVALEFLNQTFQCVFNLKGTSENSVHLKGEAYDEDIAFATKDIGVVLSAYGCQNLLACYMGEYEVGAKNALIHGDIAAEVPGVPGNARDYFSKCVCLYAMAQRTRKRKYSKKAKKIAAVVKRWSNQGNPNIKHLDLILDAEKAVLCGKNKKARKAYEAAAIMAARLGFVNDAALANERYGLYLLSFEGDTFDKEDALFRLKKAKECYSEWGATAKVNLMDQIYS